MMIRKMLCFAAALAAAVSLAGCSLLKVSVSTGDPLSKEQMRVRTLTRGFYYEMADEIARAADSIVAVSTDAAVRMAAVRWKIRATRAGVSAAMQGTPDVAMADLWILCRRMDRAFAAMPDSLLFGPQSDLARDAAQRIDRAAARLARQVLDPARYGLMEQFVEEYLETHPDEPDGAENTTLAWIAFLEARGVEPSYATGTIAEVLADVSDRVSGQTGQLTRSVGWTRDMIRMELQQDSLRSELRARLDSLERNFERMVVVAEHLPEISDAVLGGLNAEAARLMAAMDASVDNVFADFGRQRTALEQYVSREREELVEQLRVSADDLLQRTLDAVPGVVGRILLYLVLALAVLLGGPFALGFWLGGVRQRAKIRRETPDGSR